MNYFLNDMIFLKISNLIYSGTSILFIFLGKTISINVQIQQFPELNVLSLIIYKRYETWEYSKSNIIFEDEQPFGLNMLMWKMFNKLIWLFEVSLFVNYVLYTAKLTL